jgi:PAS domain S-box-containing protein
VQRGADNIKRLYAFATVAGTDWRVLAGLPEAEVFAEPGKRLSRGIAIGLATLILVLFLAWQVSATIANPLRDLVHVAGSLAAGNATARVAELGGSREIGILGEAFNAMASTLHDRETVLKEAQRLAGVGSWEWVIDTDIMTGSEEMYRLHNCTTEQPRLHFKDLAKQYIAESCARLTKAIDDAAQNGTAYDLDLKTIDGRYITARGEAVRGASGRIASIRGTWQDITERKHAEDVRTNLAAIVDNSNDAIVSRDRDNNIFSWNRAAERMFGYTAAEVIGRNISLLIPPDREGELNQNRGMHAHGGAVVDVETVRIAKGGRRIEVSVTASPIYDEQGVLLSVALIFRDISERIRKTNLMRLLESLARATNEATTPEVAMKACLERICAYGDWSLGHVALYAPGQSTGIAQTSFWHCEEPARYREFIRYSNTYARNALNGQFVGVMMRERRSVWIADIPNTRSVGRLRSAEKFGIRSGFVFPVIVRGEISGYLEFFATEVRAPDEMLLDAMGSVASQLARLIERSRAADALAQLNAELEMRVADRTSELETANIELNSFSYTIAHDMRAPVRAINGFSEIVLKTNEGKLDQASIGYLNRVVAGSKRMGALIDDLLNLARLSRQEIRRRDFNLSELATSVIASLKEAHPERTVAVTIQPGMNANGDPGLMRAALDNLIGNAWKFTAKTGAARIDIGTEQRDGWTAFCVCDNGAGFDMQYAHKLFAPFQRLHHASDFEGTGIGLATVKKIIDRHGGKIWVESAVNLGTTMYFTIGETA